MQLNKDTKWLGLSDFENSNPCTMQILKVEEENEELILQLKAPKGFRKLSLWGDLKNSLIDRFGFESEDWKNKEIKILMDTNPSTGKTVKRLI